MKNVTLKIITTVSLIISSLSIPFTISAEQTYPLGDANHDGNVNVRDAACIAHYLASGENYLLPEEADYNQDGHINVRDAAAIAKYLATNVNTLPVTEPVVTTAETTTIPVTTNVTNTETSTTTASVLSETNAVTTAKSEAITTNTTITSATTTPQLSDNIQTTIINVRNVNVLSKVEQPLGYLCIRNLELMFTKYIERFPNKYENVPYQIAFKDWLDNVGVFTIINAYGYYGDVLSYEMEMKTNYKIISSTNGEAKEYQVVRDSGLETVSLPVYKTIAVQRTIYQNDIPHDIITTSKVYDYDYKSSKAAQSEYAKYNWKALYNKSKQEIEYFYCDECDIQLTPDDEYWHSYYPDLMQVESKELFSFDFNLNDTNPIFTADATDPVSIITRTCNDVTESQYIDQLTGEIDEHMTVEPANTPINIDFDYYFSQAESASPTNETIDYECKRTKINTEVSKYKPVISFDETPDIFELIKIDNEIANIDEMISKITNS